MNKQQKPTFFVVLTTLMLALVCLIAVLGCEEKASVSDDPVGNSTIPNRVVLDTISTSNITSNSITLSWEAPSYFGKAADGSTDATLKNYIVYYIEGSSVTTSMQGIQSTSVTETTITISNLKPETTYAFIVVTTNSAGKTSNSAIKNETTNAPDTNLNTFILSYDIDSNTIFGAEKTYSRATTSNIPAGANATYAKD